MSKVIHFEKIKEETRYKYPIKEDGSIDYNCNFSDRSIVKYFTYTFCEQKNEKVSRTSNPHEVTCKL